MLGFSGDWQLNPAAVKSWRALLSPDPTPLLPSLSKSSVVAEVTSSSVLSAQW